ncbi:MAG: pyruvate ferredoxin oxidoreductase, partial [Atribacterota bacterium]
FGGPVFTEIRSALYDVSPRPLIIDFYYGLGGRDIYVEDIEKAFARIEDVVRVGQVDKHIDYLGLRE